jgi:hypothetical protein
MSDSNKSNQKNSHLISDSDLFFRNEKQVDPWFPQKNLSLTGMLFFFFMGLYGVFMVNLTWLLFWIGTIFLSPKITKKMYAFFLRVKRN